MKAKLRSVVALAMLVTAQQASAQAWSENFQSGIPSTWTMISDNKAVNAGFDNYYHAGVAARLNTNAWDTVRNYNGVASAAVTASWFANNGLADRWLITPPFQVTAANATLRWDDNTPDGSYPDSLQVLVSPTAGNTAASFTTTLYNSSATPGSSFGTHAVNLNAYIGQTITIAFRDHSYDEIGMALTNVSTLLIPTNDIKLNALLPAAGAPNSYALVGSNNQWLYGTVSNQGSATITSYTVHWQTGTGPAITQTFSADILPYATANFTFTTPLAFATAGSYPIQAWATIAGDTIHNNDSANTTIVAVNTMPTKRLMVEEATGTWCGWCVRGIVFMDSMRSTYGNGVSLVAVHNGDPMAVAAYNNYITALPGFTGFPGVIIDRREVKDPLELFDVYNAEHNNFGFADITPGTPSVSGTTLSVPVTVKPAIDMNGTYRLAMSLVEDGVAGTGSTWAQHNYYSYQSQNQPLVGQGVDYQSLTNPIPAENMEYEFVGRAVVPSVTGAAGSLPAAMTAGTTYNYTFTTTLNTAAWRIGHMHAVVMLIRSSDGQVLNSNTTTTFPSLSVGTIPASIASLNVFPNPAHDNAMLSVDLKAATGIVLSVTDMTGREVWSSNAGQHNSGTFMAVIPTAALAAGVYNIAVKTNEGTATERLSVVK